MANRILTAENWKERIRDKIGIESAYLPDSAIQSPDCITVAEANIIAQIPEYATLTDDLRVYLEYCVVLECCILLCNSMPVRLPNKESGPHASYELSVDWNNKKAEFEVEREKYIMKIIDTLFPNSNPSPLSHFSVTNPVKEWL